MRKTFILLCFWMAAGATALWAQPGYAPAYPFEIGLQIGSSHFLGDLGGQSGIGRPFLRDTDLKGIRPAFGLFARYNIGANFAARFDANFLQVVGNDNWAGKNFDATVRNTDEAWFRYYRNLNFRSRIFEFSLTGEIIPYNFELGGGYQGYSVLSPYAAIGIGVFNFRPQTQYEGNWVDLRPLSTEGQGLIDGRLPYKTTQLCVPLGFGVKWSYNDIWTMGLEVNHRLTFTDYIDDVSTDYVDPAVFYANFDQSRADMAAALARRSVELDPGNINGMVSAPGEQRGDPKDNDSYYSITLRFSYFLPPGALGGGRRYGCPVW